MSKRAQENLVAAGFLLVFLFFISVSLTYSAKAQLVPVPLAIISSILLLVQIYLQNFRPDIKLNVDTMDLFSKYGTSTAEDTIESAGLSEEESGEGGANAGKESETRRELKSVGLVLLFMGMILLIGMIPSTFLFMLGYFMLAGHEKWYRAAITSAIISAAFYFLFFQLLQVWMYDGWIVETFFA